MGKLSARGRRQVAKKNFVYPNRGNKPGGLYPIDTRNRAVVALRESSRSTTRGSYRTVKAAVCRKYPSLGSCKKGGKK